MTSTVLGKRPFDDADVPDLKVVQSELLVTSARVPDRHQLLAAIDIVQARAQCCHDFITHSVAASRPKVRLSIHLFSPSLMSTHQHLPPIPPSPPPLPPPPLTSTSPNTRFILSLVSVGRSFCFVGRCCGAIIGLSLIPAHGRARRSY
jgi:hypothetical protein